MWESIIEFITMINDAINGVVWGWPIIILILGTGLLLTIRTKCLQVTHFGESISTTIWPTIKELGKKKQTKKGSISQFEAFATAISGTVGTGNIIGVTSAILTGGPGAVLWMWISAFFGMVTNFSENVLGLYFRKKDKDGKFSGGAFYYIAEGLKWRWLAYVDAVFCLLAAIGMGGVQTNKITGTIVSSIGMVTTIENEQLLKLILGIVLAVIVAFIIIGGIKRIGKVASNLIPIMSLIFIIMALIGIFMNVAAIPSAFVSIFQYSFNFNAAAGGITGYAFSQVISKGMARGVFSNEAGLGSSVIAHSASETKEPVKQGLWGVFEVFFDTFIICTLTALLVLTTFDISSFTGAEEDTAISLLAFENNFGGFGIVIFSIILPLFAFTTTMAWSYYGEKSCEFCFQKLSEKGRKIAVLIYKIVFLLFVVTASLITSNLIWAIDDTFNGLMAIPNLICLVALSGLVAKITKNYFDRKKGINVKPMLSAYEDQNEEFIKEMAEDEIK